MATRLDAKPRSDHCTRLAGALGCASRPSSHSAQRTSNFGAGTLLLERGDGSIESFWRHTEIGGRELKEIWTFLRDNL